jgi:hypothetical protein
VACPITHHLGCPPQGLDARACRLLTRAILLNASGTSGPSWGGSAFVSAWLAYAYAVTGDRAAAQAEAEDLRKRSLRGVVTPFNLALVHLGQGDRARDVSYLEQAYAAR